MNDFVTPNLSQRDVGGPERKLESSSMIDFGYPEDKLPEALSKSI